MRPLNELSQVAMDARAFGLWPALKATIRGFGSGYLELNLRGVGPVRVRKGDSDFQTFRQIFRNGEYLVPAAAAEARLAAAYQSILNVGHTPIIVDAGANVGAASLWFARKFPLAVVLAVEPEPGNCRMLEDNVRPNAHVRVIRAAIGSEAGFVGISGEGKSWAARTERQGEGIQICTVRQLSKMVLNGKLFIVKIDIEGFESDLFSADTEWVEECTGIFVEPHDWMLPGKGTSQNFQRVMGQAGFEVFIQSENLLYVRRF